MAQDKKYYSFSSVGETDQEFKNKLAVVEEAVPLGIRTPLKMSAKRSSVFDMHTDPTALMKDNLRNLILTNHGERIMLPDFGADLKELVMELGTEDADSSIMKKISAAVSKWMPFISLQGFEPVRKVGNSGNVNKLVMRITFSIPMMGKDNLAIEIVVYEAG